MRLCLPALVAIASLGCSPAETGFDASLRDAGAGDAGPGSDGGAPGCVAGAVETTPPLADPRLVEVSGIVVSRASPGVRWVHNDSGESVARFFAIGEDGATRAEVVIDGAPTPRDWEDVAIETTSDGREVLTFGDVGDNAARDGMGTPRSSVSLVRVEAPALPTTPGTIHVPVLAVVTLTYPDAPHDCEAIFVEPESGDVYLVTKENVGAARVYRVTAPLEDGTSRVLEHLLDILPRETLVTAADADERFVVARNYGRSFLWERDGRSITETLAGTPLRLPSVSEPQGEAIALAPGGVVYASEGAGTDLHFVPVTCP